MKKHFACAAFTYAVLAMIFGVFYREFTKFSGLRDKPPSRWCIPITFCWA